MRSIVRWCLDNRAVVLLFTVILMGAGVVSMFQLRQELLPSIEFPGVFIVTADPGASPEVVDRDVSVPIAEALQGTPGAKHVITTAAQGFSTIQVQFGLDTKSKDDLDAVTQRLQQVRLPDGVQKPTVQTFSFAAFPSMTYALVATDGNLLRATRDAKEIIAPALQGAKGEAQVKVVGGEQASIAITLDPIKLGLRGVTPSQVQQALTGAQIDLPAGEAAAGTRSVPVEVLSSLRSASDLRALVVSGGDAGFGSPSPAQPGPPGVPAIAPKPVTLGDVATVTEGTSPLNGIARTDGKPSLEIQVIRAPDGNAVTLSDDIRARLAKLHLDPADQLTMVADSAVDIRASLNDLILEGLLGAALAVIVIFLFLRSLRATLVTAVSLPTSVLVALFGTQVGGFSLNVLTLAGLTIAVGRIVDDAIVVLENSYRHLQQGESAREAALNGADEVSKAVISSTLTSVAVFLPIGLVGGIISKFFLPFSVTVTIALLASLLVALTLVPVLVSFFLERVPIKAHENGGRLIGGYRPILTWALGSWPRKAMVLVLSGALLAASLGTVIVFVPKNFFSFGGAVQLDGSVTLPPGTTTQQTSDQIRAFEEVARADPDVKLVQATLSSSDFGGFTAGFATNEARLVIILKSKDHTQQAQDRLKASLNRLYGQGNATLSVTGPGPSSDNFQIVARGRDEQTLRTASDRLVAALQGVGELNNVKSSLAAEKPEVRVTVDPAKSTAQGLSPRAIAFLLAGALSPQQLGSLGAGGPLLTMRVDPAAITADRLGSLPIGPTAQLKDVASIQQTVAPSAITRQDGFREFTVTAAVRGQDVAGASNRANAVAEKVALPDGVKLDTSGGTAADINDSFASMFEAMAVAIGLVFIILVAFFRSVVTPFVILLTMPLAVIGGFFGLALSGQPLGLPALLGVLMVFGIVVSNAILLVDFVERRLDGSSIREALIEAGATRLRPILMTAVATIAALLPVAIGVSTAGGGGLISQGLAVVVEGGLISSTVLTLLVIPIVYSLVKRGRARSDVQPPVAQGADQQARELEAVAQGS